MAGQIRLDQQYRFNAAGKRRRRWLIILCVIALLLILSSLLFRIQKIEVNGCETVSEEELLESLGVRTGMNSIRFLIAKSIQKPVISPRIETLDIYMDWPGTLVVDVKERTVIGYVEYMGTYLCIDEAGYVVDSTHYLTDEMPVVQGVEIRNFRLGEPLNTASASVSQTVMEICAALRKYGISSQIVSMDLARISDIRLYTGRLEIRFGEDYDIDRKVQALAAILEKTPDAEGILHLEDIDGQIYLEKNV